MLFGSKVRYCVTFAGGEKSFNVYTRKAQDTFYGNVVEQNFGTSDGIIHQSMNAILVSQMEKIKFYDAESFLEFNSCEITIPLLKSSAD